MRHCPFCLYEDVYVESEYPEHPRGDWQVICPGCSASGPIGSYRQEAIKFWNNWANLNKGRR